MAFSGLLRPAMLAASRSPRLERTITRIPATKRVVDRFVAGETEDAAVTTTSALLRSGRSVTIDYLGEDTTDLDEARATVAHYLRLLSALSASQAGDEQPVRPLEVSLKLSALGQSLPQNGYAIAREHAHQICTAARDAGIWVTIDAEDHTTTDSTLAIVRELRLDFPWLGTVLQAYLKRTEEDCRMFAGTGSRIRLCKGAYREPASVAYQSRSAVDESYSRCLRVLMEGRGYPMVATHDPALIDAALHCVDETGRKSGDFEFQMLHGIRDAEQRRLVAAGHSLRVYVPYGDQWYGYFMRRLAERPANIAFFLRSFGRDS
ncbi:proline dehydrogenase family protein [Nocardia sp. NBC_00508]|uniref:proline dehydrogenase family protein n=1 Tax=Nocardia sp. NBC_00508 TaxID=2975992 RepID=UPI002E81126F|nr:proline dehydrogenase family protein [Nocardia sp. NBC_00508]WUD67241.1 proline dehydrogenase family protein [Nocardia sp. NBC_00508]